MVWCQGWSLSLHFSASLLLGQENLSIKYQSIWIKIYKHVNKHMLQKIGVVIPHNFFFQKFPNLLESWKWTLSFKIILRKDVHYLWGNTPVFMLHAKIFGGGEGRVVCLFVYNMQVISKALKYKDLHQHRKV